MCGEIHLAGLLAGANPEGACTSDQRKGIVADELGGAGEFEADGVGGEGADGVEFVGDAQDDAGGVGTVRDEHGVIGQQREFLIDALAGEAARDDLLALNESVDAQIAQEPTLLLRSAVKGAYLRCGNCLRSGSASATSLPAM